MDLIEGILPDTNKAEGGATGEATILSHRVDWVRSLITINLNWRMIIGVKIFTSTSENLVKL
jgi:hypothetical protein